MTDSTHHLVPTDSIVNTSVDIVPPQPPKTTITSLNDDIIFSILVQCSTLSDLHHLILSHSHFYAPFCCHRRIVLRTVYRHQQHDQTCSPGDLPKPPISTRTTITAIKAASEFATRQSANNSLDGLAFREAVWPLLAPSRRLPWAHSLLLAYKTAGNEGEAVAFGRSAWAAVRKMKPRYAVRLVTGFARSWARVLAEAGSVDEAIAVRETVRGLVGADATVSDVWNKELVTAYREAGRAGDGQRLALECWSKAANRHGHGSLTALDWARAALLEYQAAGNMDDALAFQIRVFGQLDPTTTSYHAWARQVIKAYQRRNDSANVLAVTKDVWSRFDPLRRGYRPWTLQLYSVYESLGRYDEAIAVWECAYRALDRVYSQAPNDSFRRYHVRGAGLSLAYAYEKHGRPDLAAAQRLKCMELDDKGVQIRSD